jgi:hypothetical protein
VLAQLAKTHPAQALTGTSHEQHALVLTSIFEMLVKNIDELEAQLGPALIMYGRRHYHHRAAGFVPQQFEWLGQAALTYVLRTFATISIAERASAGESAQLNSDIGHIWSTLTKFVVQKLCEGYEMESINKITGDVGK